MSRITAPGLTAVSLLAASAMATALAAPFDVPQRHLLPVESLPLKIGSWTAVSDHPVEKVVQDRLPTARIIDRIYEDKVTGNQVDVMLLTATAVDDIHKPTSCLPAQGWQLDDPRYVTVDRQKMTILDARDAANKQIHVGYWLTGYYAPRVSHGSFFDSLLALRNRAVGPDKAMSLFVRVISNGSADNTALTDFVRDALPSVRYLTAQADPSPVRQG